MSKGPWSLTVRRNSDGLVSHVLTTPFQQRAYDEAARVMTEIKSLPGFVPGLYTVEITDTDSANQPIVEPPARSGIIIPRGV